jgi:vitamin B12 transporter
MSFLRPTLLAAALTLACASNLPAHAQSIPIADPVLVTATRLPQAQSDLLAAVSVIDRAAIDASASVDVFDLLRRVPGLDAVRGGGLGQQTSLFIRGGNSNHALVLIDGVRVSALGTGIYPWEQLPLSAIERIEIVRGPRAALWGADALSGVIQIFTRRDAASRAALRLGNHDTRGVEAGTGTRSARGGFGLSAGWLDTRGTDATTPSNWSHDPDRDGALYRTLAAHGDLTLGHQQLEASLLHGDNDIEFDQGRSNTRQDVFGLTLGGELGADWSHRLSLSGGRDRLDTPDVFTRYVSRRRQADWQHSLATGARGAITLGLSWLNERGRQMDTAAGTDVYGQSRHTRAAFAAWQGRADAHAFELSGRYDDNSLYGSQSSFAGAWGWELTDALRLSANWGQGFRAPTMNELYSPGWGGWYAGNPALAPERSESTELALRRVSGPASELSLRLFRNALDQLIDFSGAQAQAINVARARTDGVELEWRWQPVGWNIETSATWQDPRNRDTGQALLRRPARKASALLERVFDGGARLGVEGHAASDRPDFGARLAGYGVLSARASLPLSAGLWLDARIDNLLDRDYALVEGYRTPGTTALLSLRWQAR